MGPRSVLYERFVSLGKTQARVEPDASVRDPVASVSGGPPSPNRIPRLRDLGSLEQDRDWPRCPSSSASSAPGFDATAADA